MGLLSSYDTAITGYEYLLKSVSIPKVETVERLLEIRSELSKLDGPRARALVDRIDAIMAGLQPFVEVSSIPDEADESTIDICLKTVGITGLLVLFAAYSHYASCTPIA